MEYFLSEFMYSHTHIYLRFLFFSSFSCIKGKENEGDSMAKIQMIKNLPIGWGPPPPIGLKHKFYWYLYKIVSMFIVYTQFKVM